MQKLTFILSIMVICAHLVSSKVYQQEQIPISFEKAKDEARTIINEMLSKYPGLSVSVGVDDKIVWSEGFGLSNAKPADSMRIDHQFRYYSLSKSITGMALIKLIEAGKLDIEKEVTSYLPDLPVSYSSVKVKYLVSHTSGIRHYKKGEWMRISQNDCSVPSDALGVFINDPLNSIPGETYSYSSFNYVLLSLVIERISGRGFFQFIQDELLTPNGITSLSMDRSEEISNEVTYYDIWIKKRSRAIKSKTVNNTCKFGGGGLVGTAPDLVKLHLAMLNNKIVSKPFRDQYYKGLEDANGSNTNYAFGLGDNVSTKSGVRYHSHTGSGRGANTVLMVYPESKLVITLLGNLENDLMNEKIGSIAKPFLNLINK